MANQHCMSAGGAQGDCCIWLIANDEWTNQSSPTPTTKAVQDPQSMSDQCMSQCFKVCICFCRVGTPPDLAGSSSVHNPSGPPVISKNSVDTLHHQQLLC